MSILLILVIVFVTNHLNLQASVDNKVLYFRNKGNQFRAFSPVSKEVLRQDRDIPANHSMQKVVVTNNGDQNISNIQVQDKNHKPGVLYQLQDRFKTVQRIRLSSLSTPSNHSLSHKSRFPHIFIIGFAKAGTKALYEALKLHIQLSGPMREMRFFTEHYESSLQKYLDKFPKPSSKGYNIEKSPDYILSLKAATRLKQAAIDVEVEPSLLKFVVIVRNPVVRSVSDHMELLLWAKYNNRSIPRLYQSQVIDEHGKVKDSVKIVNSSCYAYHINRWMEVFNKSQFCFVDGDRFIQNPYTELKKLERCLGLFPFFIESHFVYNKQRGFYCFRDSPTAEANQQICMNKSKGRTHPYVSNSVLIKMKEYFKPWNMKLYDMLGKDFNWESSDEY